MWFIISFFSFIWNLSSISKYSNFVFNVHGGTLSSTYTDTSNGTTDLTLLCTPILSNTTGSISITYTSPFQYIILIGYLWSNSGCGYSTNNNNGFIVIKQQVVIQI